MTRKVCARPDAGAPVANRGGCRQALLNAQGGRTSGGPSTFVLCPLTVWGLDVRAARPLGKPLVRRRDRRGPLGKAESERPRGSYEEIASAADAVHIMGLHKSGGDPTANPD
jgi:hypothetical protein